MVMIQPRFLVIIQKLNYSKVWIFKVVPGNRFLL